MKLTNKDRWTYDDSWSSAKLIENVRKRDEWIRVVKSFIPNARLKYLELGCAPGLYTAALAEGMDWEIYGIDYSDDAEKFQKTLSLVNKKSKVFICDLFSKRIDGIYDVVCSFGLVEHFRNCSLEEIFKIHDSYLADGGYLVIEMPNFTGFQYFWHYIFDRPDLDNHNIDVMQPSAMKWFEDHDYEIIHNDYVGPVRFWGNSSFTKYRFVGKIVAALAVVLSKIGRFLDRIGLKLRGRTWSPDFLMIARKKSVIN